MGKVAGYTAADYLLQHAARERRATRVPASTWDAALSYIRDSDDATRLANSARDRQLYRYAIPLYRYAAEAGDRYAAEDLVNLLARRGDLDEAEQVLRARADAGDSPAAVRLADLLIRRGDLDELRARADAGDTIATQDLVNLLARRGDLDEAEQVLRARADAGDSPAAWRLAGLLPYRGKNKPASQKEANRTHAKLRSPGERANAQLKTWRILRKLRCCPWRAGLLAKAIHVLQIREA